MSSRWLSPLASQYIISDILTFLFSKPVVSYIYNHNVDKIREPTKVCKSTAGSCNLAMSTSATILRNKYGFEYSFKSDPLAGKALRYLKTRKHLLDVGCGEGADSVFFAKKGFQVTAMDNNKIYLSRLRAFISE